MDGCSVLGFPIVPSFAIANEPVQYVSEQDRSDDEPIASSEEHTSSLDQMR
jgi:hypothetical protein